jgi:hypothetical protein
VRATDRHPAAVARLEADGLIRLESGAHHTTRRWQGLMARAATRLVHDGEPVEDLRVPIAFALLEVYGADLPDAELADLVEAMIPIEGNFFQSAGPGPA